MEHIEQAGIHSGDSALLLPSRCPTRSRRRSSSAKAWPASRSPGLMNIQFAVKDDELYVIEVNPRASRTVPSFPSPSECLWPNLLPKSWWGKVG